LSREGDVVEDDLSRVPGGRVEVPDAEQGAFLQLLQAQQGRTPGGGGTRSVERAGKAGEAAPSGGEGVPGPPGSAHFGSASSAVIQAAEFPVATRGRWAGHPVQSMSQGPRTQSPSLDEASRRAPAAGSGIHQPDYWNSNDNADTLPRTQRLR